MEGSIRKTVTRLGLVVLGMFCFGWALIPLYDLLCEVTGLNGKTGGQYTFDAAMVQPDKTRLLKVNFLTNTNGGMVWDFHSEKGGVRVHPGELKTVNFIVRNPTDKVMVGQAIPSVSPGRAAEHFHKTECFCFEQQVLQPGEELKMPMRFLVGPELPKNIESISLSYALFDITDTVDQGVLAAASASSLKAESLGQTKESKQIELIGEG